MIVELTGLLLLGLVCRRADETINLQVNGRGLKVLTCSAGGPENAEYKFCAR